MTEQQYELLLVMATVLRALSHQFVGRLAWDPELKTFDSGKCVAKCRLLVNLPSAKRDDGSKPDAFTLELWGDDGQRFVDECHKGDLVQVRGRCRTNRYQDRQGQQQIELVVNVDHWELLRQPRHEQDEQDAPQPPAPAHPAHAAAGWAPAAAPAPSPMSDDAIPF